MKFRLAIISIALSIAFVVGAPEGVFAQDDEASTEKTYCTYAYGYGDAETMKNDLLINVKRQAVNEIFGELISAMTVVDNSIVTSDQVRASSLGFVRVSGNPEYTNGSGLGEVCVAIRAFVTADDLEEFTPTPLSKRLCQARPDLSADDLAKFVKEEAIIQALYDYDVQLAGKERAALLSLMKRINYLESGFLKDTTTYCVEVEGYVTPVEVLAFVNFDGLPAEDGVSAASKSSTISGQPTAYPVESRMAEPCADTIEFGQMLECSLDNEGQKNRHTFEANGGDRIIITVVRTSGDLQPSFEVRDREGKQIPLRLGVSNLCAAAGQSSGSETCTLEKSGSYTVIVHSRQTGVTGNYRLDIQRLNNPGYTASIEFGELALGELSQNNEEYYYTFAANAEDRIVIDLVRSSGDIDPWFGIYDKKGDLIKLRPGIANQCVGSGAKHATEICTLDLSGIYTIRIGAQTKESAGSYALEIQRLNAPRLATLIEFGESVDNSISRNAEKHYYTFTANPEDVVDISVIRTDGDINPWFQVYDKGGNLIRKRPGIGNYCVANGPKNAQNTCTLEKSGLYTIMVGNSSWDYTGSYRLTLNR